jgi:hypothetical protein
VTAPLRLVAPLQGRPSPVRASARRGATAGPDPGRRALAPRLRPRPPSQRNPGAPRRRPTPFCGAPRRARRAPRAARGARRAARPTACDPRAPRARLRAGGAPFSACFLPSVPPFHTITAVPTATRRPPPFPGLPACQCKKLTALGLMVQPRARVPDPACQLAPGGTARGPAAAAGGRARTASVDGRTAGHPGRCRRCPPPRALVRR